MHTINYSPKSSKSSMVSIIAGWGYLSGSAFGRFANRHGWDPLKLWDYHLYIHKYYLALQTFYLHAS